MYIYMKGWREQVMKYGCVYVLQFEKAFKAVD